MLRLRVRIERVDGLRRVEAVAIANSGFAGLEPKVLLPQGVARGLELHTASEPELHTKVLGAEYILMFRGYVYIG